MENKVFKKVTCDPKNESIHLYANFTKTSFELILFQQQHAWSSTITQDALLDFSQLHQLDFEEYFTKLKDYFMTSQNGVIFSFDNDEFTLFRIVENDIKVKYFSHKLKNVEYSEIVENLLYLFFDSNNQLLKRLNELQKENQENLMSKNESELKLREFLEMKQLEEESLLSSFVQVLNEKKRRIQHLSELLEAFNKGRPTSNPSVGVKRRKRKKEDAVITPKIEKKEVISDSGGDDDDNSISNYHTDKDSDDDNNGQVDNIKIEENHLNPMDNCKPSTSKTKSALDFLDNELCEFPSSHSLPKRVRSESNISRPEMSIPTLKNANQNQNEKELPKTQENRKSQDNNTQAGPAVEFNTQDLLDLL